MQNERTQVFVSANSPTFRPDARVLLLPFALNASTIRYSQASLLGWVFKFKERLFDLSSHYLCQRPLPISYADLGDTHFLLAIFAILVLRFTRTRGEEDRFTTEVEGARSAQQYLLPKIWFRIECNYRPGLEIGGDFFQVMPIAEDSSVLVLIGNVAGKGLQAGMLSTLLVGTMRTAATFTHDPGAALGVLNKMPSGPGQRHYASPSHHRPRHNRPCQRRSPASLPKRPRVDDGRCTSPWGLLLRWSFQHCSLSSPLVIA